jgi:hypothetical protein
MNLSTPGDVHISVCNTSGYRKLALVICNNDRHLLGMSSNYFASVSYPMKETQFKFKNKEVYEKYAVYSNEEFE